MVAWPDAVIQLLSGLTAASILFIVASGLTLVFGAMRVINMAHGSFYMYAAFILATVAGGAAGGDRFWVGLVAAVVLVTLLGGLVEVGILRRIYDKEHLTQLLATFALVYIFADLALQLWGGVYRSVPVPADLDGQVEVFGRAFPVYNFFLIGLGIAVGAGLWLLLQRTTLGWQVRAMVEDPELLAAAGVNVRRVGTVAFMVGALLAAIAGAARAPGITIAPGMDTDILVDAFIVAVIGGLGSVTGAALGALIIGIFQAVGVLLAAEWSSAFIYLAMILVLIVRPSGLLGIPER